MEIYLYANHNWNGAPIRSAGFERPLSEFFNCQFVQSVTKVADDLNIVRVTVNPHDCKQNHASLDLRFARLF